MCEKLLFVLCKWSSHCSWIRSAGRRSKFSASAIKNRKCEGSWLFCRPVCDEAIGTGNSERKVRVKVTEKGKGSNRSHFLTSIYFPGERSFNLEGFLFGVIPLIKNKWMVVWFHL